MTSLSDSLDAELNGPLVRPAWLLCSLYAAAMTGIVCYAAWPGFMSADSLSAYEQGWYGIQTMLWPPLHAYMFGISQRLGTDAGGVLVFQTFVLFFSAAVVIFSLVRHRVVAGLLCLGFALSFGYVPPQLGTLFALWRDVPTASFAFLALALWLQAARRQSAGLLVAAVVALGLSVGLRYNAIALVAGLIGLMIWRPYLAAGDGRHRAVVLVSLVLVLGLAWASTRWRIPDLLQLPAPDNFAGTQEFDVIGVSACAGKNYMPRNLTAERPLTVAEIRWIYDPRHLQNILSPRPGLPQIYELNGSAELRAAWRSAVAREPGCYLAHRSLVMVEQLGMAKTSPFYPTNAGINANRFGLTLAHPAVAAGFTAYVKRNAIEWPRRPYLLYIGALIASGLGIWLRREHTLLILAVLAGILAYPGLLFFAGPAADARYIFPSSTLASLLMLVVAGWIADRYIEARAVRRPA